ncbi:MAG: transcription termination/antitermination protein NusG [Mycoplasma sp.]|nr:transcription termination/antitermination protein NusG [Mycoplasma sp.]
MKNEQIAKWYIATSIIGNEDVVYKNLEDKIRAYQLNDLVHEIKLLKTREITVEIFDNTNNPPPRLMRNTKSITWETLPGNRYKKTKIREINRFPGYIYIKMVMTPEAWYIIRNTFGITGFVGSSGKGAVPIPMSDSEVEFLFRPENNEDIIINKTGYDYVEPTVDSKEIQREVKVEFLSSASGSPNNNANDFFDSQKIAPESDNNPLNEVANDRIENGENAFDNFENSLENQEISKEFSDEPQVEESSIYLEESDETKKEESLNEQELPKSYNHDFLVGHTVKIISGPMADSVGNIKSISEDGTKIEVEVNLFGRETIVTVTPDLITKEI